MAAEGSPGRKGHQENHRGIQREETLDTKVQVMSRTERAGAGTCLKSRGPLSSWEGVLSNGERMCKGELGRNRHGQAQSWRERVKPTVRPLCPRGDPIPKEATARVGKNVPDPAGPVGSKQCRSNVDKCQGPTVEKPAPPGPLLLGI